MSLAVLAAATALACDAGQRTPSDAGETNDAASMPPVPEFTDVSREAGIEFVHHNGAAGNKLMPETVGSGGAWLDYDTDGWPDLFLVNGSSWDGSGNHASALLRNEGDGSFEDVTAETGAGIRVQGMGAAVGDYDADGDPDIYLTAVGPNVLLRNDGGRFVDVTRRMGVTGGPAGRDGAWSTAAAWLDYDLDGRLDLFVCNYVKWSVETDLFHTLDGSTKAYATPEPYEGDTCLLYANRGDGRAFENVSRTAGVHDPTGKAMGILVDDFDADGWPDIVVTNDTEPNFLYMNRRDGTFDEVGLRAGIGVDATGRARAGMGVAATAIGDSARLAVAIGNFAGEAVSLYTMLGPGVFQDRAASEGLAGPTRLPLTFGVLFLDVNLDGRDDLVLANGHIEPTVGEVREGVQYRQPMQLFLQTEGRFVDATDRAGAAFRTPVVGRGLAAADYDRDGDPDLLVTENGGPARLLRNDLEAASRVRVVVDGSGDAPAEGTVITAYDEGTARRWYVTGSGSYLTQSELNVRNFGTGRDAWLDSLVIVGAASGGGPVARTDRRVPAGTTVRVDLGELGR